MRRQLTHPFLLACAVAATLALPGRASADMVTNGGFETGDFSGWTQIGNIDFNGVSCPGVGNALAGNCDAYFGPVGSTGGIVQTLSTVVGQTVLISFDYAGDGGAPGSFQVDFGGQTLLAQTNASAVTQSYSFSAVATATTSDLRFLFRDDSGFMTIDNVQVAAVPEPASLALFGVGLAVLVARRGRARTEASAGCPA